MKRLNYLLLAALAAAFVSFGACEPLDDDYDDDRDHDHEVYDDPYFDRTFVIGDNPFELMDILEDALDRRYRGVICVDIEGLNDDSDFWGYAELWNTFDSHGDPVGETGIYDRLSLDLRILPNPHLTYLGDFMFSRAACLVNIDIPEGVQELGYGCLRGTSITSLRLPRTLHYIGDDACSRTFLQKVDLHYVTHLGRAAFAYNEDLRDVYFCDDLSDIPQDAFYKCNLDRVDLPRYLISIGRTAFAYNHIQFVDLPDRMEFLDVNCFARNDLEAMYFYGRMREIVDGVPDETRIYVPERLLNYYLDFFPPSMHSKIFVMD